MNIDWNWFFSSFSQSAAALLGIIGAFIISKLIGIDEKANILSSDFEDLKIAYNKIKDSFSIRKYSWVNKTLIKYDDDIIKQIQYGEFEDLSENEILETLYEQDSRLYHDDQSILNAFNELYEKYNPKGDSVYVNNPFPTFNFPPDGTWDKIGSERDLINKHIVDASELIRKFSKHLKSLENFASSLQTIKMIVWILIISFPFTVIYPLHFLPIEIGKEPVLTYNIILIIKCFITLKNILLTVFLIAVEGIFVYFLFLLRQIKLRLSNIEKEHLAEFTDINSYCKYYRE